MNIILFYQHIAREYYSIINLSNILSQKGHTVYIYSIDFELDRAIRTAKKSKIDVVVTPWLYHNRNYEEFIPFIRLNKYVKLINLHSEQIYAPFSRIAVMPAKGVASDCAYHFCWSKHFRDALIEDGVKEHLCYITGNMRNDEAFDITHDRCFFSNKYNLDSKKKWILFAENRNFVNSSQGNNGSFSIKGVTQEEIDERMDFYQKTLKETIRDINDLPLSFFEEYELIYRAHPGFEGNMGVKNENVREISEYSIYEWLNATDVCVVWNSTVAFESDLMHVPVFICSPIPIIEKYRTVGLDGYTTIRSLIEIKKFDLALLLEKQTNNSNYKFYLGEVDGNASRKVADAIENVYDQNDGYQAKIIKYKRFYHIKKYISTKVLRIFICLRIFDLLKYPRSAYQHKKDIPFYPGNIKK